ncbi:MAG TPA: hypothetical protein VFM33_00120, partial [Aquabacterium sp.]|nr:hypothetical protein [Aquabacterium sp.]
MLSRTTSLPLPLGMGKRHRFQRHAVAVAAWIGTAMALILLIWLVFPGSAGQASHPAVSWDEPRFRMLPTAQDPGTDWQTVTLPDTWATRQLASRGVARYEIGFQLAPLDHTLRSQT